MNIIARPELIDEIKKHKDLLFHIYPTDVFLRRAKETLAVEIKEGTLNEIEGSIKEFRKNIEKINALDDSISSEFGEILTEMGDISEENHSITSMDSGEINIQDQNSSSID